MAEVDEKHLVMWKADAEEREESGNRARHWGRLFLKRFSQTKILKKKNQSKNQKIKKSKNQKIKKSKKSKIKSSSSRQVRV